MRHLIALVCLAVILAVSSARGDILPTPDRGPPTGRAGGLDFAIETVRVNSGPANGPHYQKSLQVVVLVGCVAGQSNCTLARSKNLIGMEVRAVDGKNLRPETGMVQQIIDAFADKAAAQTVILELFSRASQSEPIKVSFTRR